MIPNIRLGRRDPSSTNVTIHQPESDKPQLYVIIRLPIEELDQIREDEEVRQRMKRLQEEQIRARTSPRRRSTPKIRPLTSEINEVTNESTNNEHDTNKDNIEHDSNKDNIEHDLDDIFSLDKELNRALQESPIVDHKQPPEPTPAPKTKSKPKPKPIIPSESKERYLGYRPIPKNIIPFLEQELAKLNPDESDELGIIDRIIFTLKDPLGAGKIKLPVKSAQCQHFECFDFENFCVFNKIPPGIQKLLRKDIAKRKYAKLSQEKAKANAPTRQLRNSQTTNNVVNVVENPSGNVPKYKCPLCDKLFPLYDLSVDDSFNYFVKITPQETERIEILDMRQYKIVDEMSSSAAVEDEVIVLSSEEEDSVENTESNVEDKTQQDSENDLFDDGWDEELLRLGTDSYRGSGSWEDPVTLD